MGSANTFFMKGFCCTGILFIVLVNAACNFHKNDTKDSSGEKLDRLIAMVDKLAAQTREPGVKIADSLYNALLHPSIEDLCDKYLLKSYFSQDSYSTEEQYADSTLWFLRNNGLERKYISLYGRACLYRGKAMLQQRKFNEAYLCYSEGIRDIQSTHDTVQFSQFNGKLGTVCYAQGDYLHAAYYYLECVQENQKYYAGKDNFLKFREQQGNLDNIGLCYSKSGMPDSAIYYFHAALDYIDKYSPEILNIRGAKEFIEAAQGIIYGNLGTAYFNKEEFKNAEELYDKSISINNRKGYEINDARLTQLKLVELYLKMHRLNEADTLLQQYKAAVEGDSNADNRHINVKWYKLEADYYNLIHRPGLGYAYLNAYYKKTDSIATANKKFISIDFNKVYEDIIQQDFFLELKKQDEYRNESNIIAIFFLAVVIGVAVFVSKNNKQLKELNQKSTGQNKEMQKALDALEQSHKENTRMMEVLANDLRNPLSTIKSMASLLMEEEVDKETQKDFLSTIRASSSALLVMIADVLYTNITLEEMKKELVDMKELMHYCVDLMKFKAVNKKQNIALKAEAITLEIDREKIWRVLVNLINNAIKLSPWATTIKVELLRTQDTVQISVKDNSAGIPGELKDKVFEDVTGIKKINDAGKELPFGSGLSVTKQIVEALGGKIWFESKKDEGTTFYIEFPKEMIN